VNFFSRKGADALGKYMGEAERSLRLLFEEAKRRQPSIIFFDEIDGLAPSRKRVNGEQDAIHGSVVATLLALMDGLDDRGRVVGRYRAFPKSRHTVCRLSRVITHTSYGPD
jgi:SpoVK/Ycf46/Vps4 family AAA+-type ATPase